MGVIIKGSIPRGPHHFPYVKGDLPGTPKDMGPPYGKLPTHIYSYIFPGIPKLGVPCPWGSLKIPLTVPVSM